MGKAGRKRKAGKRTQSGRLSRAGVTPFDRGTERAQAMLALYGQEGADAIGRAWKSELLGDTRDAEAKAMLDTARKISNAYWAAYETGPITCTLGDRSGGGSGDASTERVKRREEWLNDCLDRVKALGHDSRLRFDQLVIDVNPDHGPQWLDRLCFASRCRTAPIRPEDAQALALALEALAMLAGVDAPRVARLKAA